MALASTIEVNSGTLSLTGIIVAIMPGIDTTIPVELWRAPDLAGAPDVANALLVVAQTLAPGGMHFVDQLATDGAIFWYRQRLNGGAFGAGPYTEWVNMGAADRLSTDIVQQLVNGDATRSSGAWQQQTARQGTHTQQMLANPGFEDGSLFWFPQAGTMDITNVSAEANSGNRYMKLTSTTGAVAQATSGDDLGKTRYFEVNPGDVIQFGGAAYRVSGTANVRYVLETTDKDKATAVTVATANQNTAAWVTITSQTTVGAGKKYARVWAEIDATGTGVVARFDDVFLRVLIQRNLPFSDSGYAVLAASTDGKQTDRSVSFAGQQRTLLQMLTYEIPNAEFDMWETSAQPHAWTVDTGDSSVATQETSVVFAGDNSLKYSFGAGGSAGTFRGITSNDPVKGAFCIPLHPGTWYQFKFASRVTSTTNAPTYKVTLTHDVGGTLNSTATFTYRLANKWQLDYFKFLVPATAEARTRLKIEFTRGATTALDFYIDGVRLQDKGTQRTVILTTGTTWAVPSDFNPADNTIECWGGGGGGGGGSINVGSGGGGGGGEYRKKRNFDPGSSTSITVALGGGGTFGGAGVAGGAGGDTTFNTSTVVAKGGGGGGGGASGTAGNAGSGGTGPDGNNNGGTGGTGSTGTGNRSAGAGGGAGGPSAAGGAGGNGVLNPVAGTTGGNAGGPSGGTGGTGSNAGTDGTTYSSTDDGTSAGGGGGGGGGQAGGGGNGGNYGGAGGGGGSTAGSSGAGNAGHGGVIVISWRTP